MYIYEYIYTYIHCYTKKIYIGGWLVADNNNNPSRRIRGRWTSEVGAVEQSTILREVSEYKVGQSITEVPDNPEYKV